MNFVEILDKKLEDLDKKRKEERGERDGHYPSEANACLRKLYYKWKRFPETNPIEGKDLLKMVIGNKIHELIVEILREANVELIPELDFKVYPPALKYPVRGRLDIIYIDKNTNDMCGVEIKTISGNGVYKLIKDNKPNEEHLWQAACYLWYTDIQKLTLLYVARDKAFKTQYVLYKDKNNHIYLDGFCITFLDKAKYERRLEDLEAYIIGNIVPIAEYKVCIVNGEIKEKFQHERIEYKSDWQCMYCQYLDLCRAQDKELYKEGKFYGGERIC